jgi:hypothetical protein
MVGRPLSCDESTYNCLRLDYARVCVEVDASLPYVHKFEIDSPLTSEPITVKVDYEWKPSRCEKCLIFGHSCPITPTPLLNKGKLPATTPIPKPNTTLTPIKPPTDPSTSAQPPSIEVPIPIPIPALPQSIPNSTTNLPPAGADMVVAPRPPTPIPTLNAPISLPNPNDNPISDDPKPLDEGSIDANPNSDDSKPLDEGSTGHRIQHPTFLDTTNCLVSKMDSLQSTSEASSAIEASTAETSTASYHLMRVIMILPILHQKLCGRKKVGGNGRRPRAFNGCKFLFLTCLA